MDTLPSLAVFAALGYVGYWAILSVTRDLGIGRPYSGHSSYASMRIWGWIKAVSVTALLVTHWPEPELGYPLREPAWITFLVAYLVGHIHWLLLPARWWHERAA